MWLVNILYTIALEWNHVSKPKVFLDEDGDFIINFDNMNDQN